MHVCIYSGKYVFKSFVSHKNTTANWSIEQNVTILRRIAITKTGKTECGMTIRQTSWVETV